MIGHNHSRVSRQKKCKDDTLNQMGEYASYGKKMAVSDSSHSF